VPSGTQFILLTYTGVNMSPEIALLNEVWEKVKDYIPKKERVVTAEAVLQTFEDHVDMAEIELYKNEFDSSMKAAILSNLDLEDEDEFEEDWE